MENEEVHFDEDELINDYYENEADGPPQYDEYMYEEAMLEEDEGNTPKMTTVATPLTAIEASKPESDTLEGSAAVQINGKAVDGINGAIVPREDTGRPTTNIDDDDRGDSDADCGEGFPLSTVTVNLNASTKEILTRHSDKESSLYAFERYSGKHEWRTILKSSDAVDTMQAQSWKQKLTLEQEQKEKERQKERMNERNDLNITSCAPEAQLVKYLSSMNIRRSISGSTDRNRYQFITKDKSRGMGMPVEGESSVPVTILDGSMLHIPRYANVSSSQINENVRLGLENISAGSLLGVTMDELLKKADVVQRRADRRKRFKSGSDEPPSKSIDEQNKNESERTEALELGEKMEEKTAEENDENTHIDIAKGEQVTESKIKTSNEYLELKQQWKQQQLWVDKHAPTHFSDLLSEERSNREVLRALRLWDPFVFQRAAPLRPAIFNTFSKEGKSNANSSDNNNKSRNVDGNEVDDGDNERMDLRPDEQNRVILLSGPPGVGKTTLAHIVAKHAGYRPIEVNASDERSASVLTERVLRAMESNTLNIQKSLIDSNNKKMEDIMAGRPNCLILDEIDGADARASISALVEIIRADLPSRIGSNKNNSGKGNNSRKKNKPYLRRPIIFICNHKYAPSLKHLLPYARQFDISPPSSNRLVARLRSVLTAENMTMIGGSKLLFQLVAGSGGDIRSCLYTLQFASARAKEIDSKKRNKIEGYQGTGVTKDKIRGRNSNPMVDISPALNVALGGNGRGMKDEQTEITGTLSAVFRKLKNRKLGGVTISRKKNGFGGDVNRVLKAVECFGNNSKTLDCLFTNLLRVSYVDPTLDKCWSAHEWLSSADIYRSYKTAVASNNNAEHQAMQKLHIPSAAAAIHLLCRVETRPDLTFSTRQMMDAVYLLEANSGLVNKFLEGLSPKARCGINGSGVTTEFLPFCLWLLSAGNGRGSLHRPVSSLEILSKDEKSVFDKHVATLRALGLTYVKEDENKIKKNHENGKFDNKRGMRLEPEIENVISFHDLKPGHGQRRREIPAVMKELLAHAADLEDMRDREREANENNHLKQSSTKLDKLSLESAKSARFEFNEKKESHNKSSVDLNKKETNKLESQKVANSQNFLGIGAIKAKAARAARRKAALSGLGQSKHKSKRSHTGSGALLSEVIKFKYQKGFTQAVRLPCSKEDIV